MVFLLVLLLSPAHAAPSTACAPCHREIFDRHRRTPMALTSGIPSSEDMARSTFTHAASGFRYRVSRDAAGLTLEVSKSALHLSRTLSWYIGSGATALSFLLADDGY